MKEKEGKGQFIVFEGIDGCGKSTQLELFYPYLKERLALEGKPSLIFTTYEPNELDKDGRKAMRAVHEENPSGMDVAELARSFAYNRRTHNGLMDILIGNGVSVLCDRYYYSSIAYQSVQGVPREHILALNHGIRIPDITFYIDVPVDVAVGRLSSRGKNGERFEKFEFLGNVRAEYLEMLDYLREVNGDESIVFIKGVGSPKTVHRRIVESYEKASAEDRFMGI